MRFSLKLLILLTILFAVTMAWLRARREYIAAEAQSLGNKRWHTEYVLEADGRSSSIAINAVGEVQSARLAGPAGYADLRKRPGAVTQAWGLSLTSREAFLTFDPHEFPNLKLLSVSELDYDAVSFSHLDALHDLQRLTIDARTSNPLPALSTLPEMPNRLQVNLRMDQIRDPENFPRLAGVATLVLHVPVIDEAAVEMIRGRLPHGDVLVVTDQTQ